MLRKFAFVVLIINFISCDNKKKQDNDKRQPREAKLPIQLRNDTLADVDLYSQHLLQADVFLDTINIPGSKRHLGGAIVYPKFFSANTQPVSSKINTLVKQIRNDFLDLTKDDMVSYNEDIHLKEGYGFWVTPQLVYHTDSFVSIALLNVSGFSTGTSSFEYHTINFDLKKNKTILFRDYFKLRTIEDTSFFTRLIAGSGDSKFNFLMRLRDNEQFNFAFNDSLVCLLFDRYDLGGLGEKCIRKKYIIDYINPAYR